MCKDAFVGDLVASRIRWYDLPALLLLHRPTRCRMCNRRYFLYRGVNRRQSADDRASSMARTFLPKLGDAYLCMAFLILMAIIFFTPGNFVDIPQRMAKAWTQKAENSPM
ncbi:hypothetical protein [Planctomicrobium sp. SH527]|uniref:hypothetical protein n=1 Tax=Planctomicrobium sp. SH527 TaxID=3448123 RepID=UPI003F5B6C4A